MLSQGPDGCPQLVSQPRVEFPQVHDQEGVTLTDQPRGATRGSALRRVGRGVIHGVDKLSSLGVARLGLGGYIGRLALDFTDGAEVQLIIRASLGICDTGCAIIWDGLNGVAIGDEESARRWWNVVGSAPGSAVQVLDSFAACQGAKR
jgi:hypothetical protein